MRTKVVGVTFCNEDGSSRAKIISGMSELDQICLERDPYNPYDANAVKVCVIKDGEKKQIGFLSKDIASDISSKLRRNVTFSVYAANVGFWNDRPFCELDITENSSPKTTVIPQPAAPTGPTFNPTRSTTATAPSPTFNPTRSTTTTAPSPTSNPIKPTTTNTPKPSFGVSASTTKKSGNNTSDNSGCFGFVVGIVVVISVLLSI